MLIASFLFTLEEFAREILFLLDTVSEVGEDLLCRSFVLLNVQIVQAEHVSAWDHVRSIVVRKKKQPRKSFLYQRLR